MKTALHILIAVALVGGLGCASAQAQPARKPAPKPVARPAAQPKPAPARATAQPAPASAPALVSTPAPTKVANTSGDPFVEGTNALNIGIGIGSRYAYGGG